MSQKKLLSTITDKNQNLKYFYILSSIYVAGLIASLTVAARLFPLHVPIVNMTILLTGGTWTIPFSFFIQDITTEVYGYQKSRQLIWLSIVIVSCYIFYMKMTTFLPIPGVKNIDQSYNTVFNALPRHLFALLAAIFIGNVVNDYIISKLKCKLKGKYLPFRFIFATVVGEAILQLVGTSVAWFGTLSFKSDILPFVLFSYCYKIFFEAAMTPINVVVCKWLKKSEGIDVYDTDINYNPLSFK